jgi:hypothetical protein
MPKTTINGDQIRDANINDNHIAQDGINAQRIIFSNGESIPMSELMTQVKDKVYEQEVQQITKLNVTASSTTPKVIELDLNQTLDFKRKPIDVLKLTSGVADTTKTLMDFSNGEADDFQTNNNITFDGKMYPKTEYTETPVDEGLLKNYTTDLQNGNITFDNAKTDTDTVEADYIYFDSNNNEVQINQESLTTSDYQTYNFVNAPIKEGSIVLYVNGTKKDYGKVYSKQVDLTNVKSLENIELI